MIMLMILLFHEKAILVGCGHGRLVCRFHSNLEKNRCVIKHFVQKALRSICHFCNLIKAAHQINQIGCDSCIPKRRKYTQTHSVCLERSPFFSGETESFYLLMPRFDLNFLTRMIYSGAEIKKRTHIFNYLLSRVRRLSVQHTKYNCRQSLSGILR